MLNYSFLIFYTLIFCDNYHLNPSNAEATILEKHLNPVIFVIIEYLAECSQMSTHVPGFQSFFTFFVLAKLATSCIRVKQCYFDNYSKIQDFTILSVELCENVLARTKPKNNFHL